MDNILTNILTMRNLMGILVGVIVGALSMFAYDHYLGTGTQLAEAQAALTKAQSDLVASNTNAAKTNQDSDQLKSQNDALSAQVQQLATANEGLQHKLAEMKKNLAAGAPAANPMAKMVSAHLKAMYQSKLQLLISRLQLTPDQVTTVTAAMDAEAQQAEKMASSMFEGGKVETPNPSDAQNVKSLDQTLKEILTPEQATAYQQLQTEEKTRQADTMATVQANQLAPALQLTDAQKDQVYNALYQAQLSQLNPTANPNKSVPGSDPANALDDYNKTLDAALAKVLTPDQMASYHQQMQSQNEMAKALMNKMKPATTSAPAADPANP